MRTIIERIDAGKVSQELERLGIDPGQAVRVTVEPVDDATLEVGGLLDKVRHLSGDAERLTDDTLDEILREVDGAGT